MGCIGFAVLFGAKEGKIFIFSAIGAAINWLIFLVAYHDSIDSLFAATLAGAAFVAFYSVVVESLAKIPATVILTACIFPLIPGSDLYYTVSAAILHNHDLFLTHGRTLILICIGISVGFIVVDVAQKYMELFRLKIYKYRRSRQK